MSRLSTRSEPRETGEVLESLGLAPRALAAELRRATPAWVEWVKLAPILLALAGGFAAVAVRWERAASKDDVAVATGRVAEAAEQRVRALEQEVRQLGRQVLELRLAATGASADLERRVYQLEQQRSRRR